MPSPLINNILVLDEMPAIALGLQGIFRAFHESIHIEHVENIFTALSSKSYEGKKFELAVIGEQLGSPSDDLLRRIAELQHRFGPMKIMVYSPNYDHTLLEKIETAGIDAYVHKYESIEEIRKAFTCLLAGETYISPIYQTLYYEYGLIARK